MSERKGLKNLRPFGTRSEAEEREIRSKGGKKSGEVRRERKAFKELLHIALMEKNPDLENKEEVAQKVGVGLRLPFCLACWMESSSSTVSRYSQ